MISWMSFMRMASCRRKGQADRRTRSLHLLSIMLMGVALLVTPLVLVVQAAPATAASPTCLTAGSTGLTATVLATTGQTISHQVIDASGCDIGIYVGTGVTGVTISGNTITHANDHAILAEDTSGITIKDNTVTDNGLNPTPGIFDDKAVELVGTSNSTITDNTITDHWADGGIGVFDNGPMDSGAPRPGPSTPVPATADTISGNKLSSNFHGCGIVVSAHNPGGGITNITVNANTVIGAPGVSGPHGPVIGGIVINAPRAHTALSDVTVSNNTITGAYIAGIALYAAGSGSTISSVRLTGNTMSGNDWGETSGRVRPTAIAVAAYPTPPVKYMVPPTVTDTVITNNTITDEFYGVWLAYATNTISSPNNITTTPGGTAVYNAPQPGGGYWLAASDGGVFSFGDAKFYGSMGGKHLNAPVVAIAQTVDQGGYWLAASDGGVFSFGDASFYGSMGGKHLNAPVVAIVPTPYYVKPPGPYPNPGAKGYWEVASDGGIFSFGDAKFYGSMGGKPLSAPIVAMATTPDGHGYWEVAADGGIFSFGDAKFYGSMGGKPLAAPMVAIATTPSGLGYWLVGADGGVFCFGDAQYFGFYGSMGGRPLKAPIITMATTPDGKGYWLVAADGGIFSFGDARFYGSMGGKPLAAPVVAGSAVTAIPSP